MADALLFLAPGFLFQILFAVLLLWLFVHGKNEVGLGKILIVSLLYTLVNILIEWALQDYLFFATLVIQWCFFTLLAQRFISIPLPRAALTMTCYFSILMGTTLISSQHTSPEVSANEKLLLQGFEEDVDKMESSTLEQEKWALRLKSNLIAHRALEARQQIRSLLYPAPEVKKTPPSPRVDPQPPANPQNVAMEEPEKTSGKEFEKLFISEKPMVAIKSSPEASPESTSPPPDEKNAPLPFIEPTPVRPPKYSSRKSLIRAEEMSEIVEIRNRSTDPRYTPPAYSISAITMGVEGRYAIIDGEILKEGSILRTQLEDPRGWRLFKIAKNEIFWQPLR